MDFSLPRALHDAMSTRLGDGWLTGEGRRLYGGDDSRRWAMPSAVALPRTREDVVALVRACREHRVPLVARGAGTGTTGAAVAIQATGTVQGVPNAPPPFDGTDLAVLFELALKQ